MPKARSEGRYSLVLIGATGKSQQIELTPWRLRAAVGLLGGLVVITVIVLAGGFIFRMGSGTKAAPDQALLERVNTLQEEVRQKDLALSVQEKRLKEMQEVPTLAVGQSRPPRDVPATGPKSGPVSGEGGPLLSMQEPVPEAGTGRAAARSGESEVADDDANPPKASGEESPDPKETPEAPKTPVINFNAQRVTALAEGQNSGTLSFQLVKDHPDIRFSGYLFVFVEMVEGQENKIYAYPKRARLGDEDLPTDFREGESVSFKYNSRVELPYSDIRPSAALSRVSIILYGQNGKIVFQRGFDRREVKLTNTKAGTAEGRSPGAEKRRAL